jgi:hypothetical protein
MAEIPNLREKLKELEEDSKKLHNAVFEAFKEAASSNDEIEFSPQLNGHYLYNIGCGEYKFGSYTHMIFYFDGAIQLFRMKFGHPDHIVKEWSTVEDFKKEILGHLKK